MTAPPHRGWKVPARTRRALYPVENAQMQRWTSAPQTPRRGLGGIPYWPRGRAVEVKLRISLGYERVFDEEGRDPALHFYPPQQWTTAPPLPSSPRLQRSPAAVLEGAPGDHPFVQVNVTPSTLATPVTPTVLTAPAGSIMAPWCYCLLYLLIGSLSGTPANSPGESRSPWVTAPLAPGEVVETADAVCRFPGRRLSWWQAQESCEQRFGHLALGPLDGVLAPRLPHPIWVGQKEAPLRRPPHRRWRTTAALMFGERSAERAARLRTPLPALGALTACAHVQCDAASPDTAALFSLAVPALANALQLRAFAEPGGAVHAALVVRGHHAPFLAAFPADGRWHHVCATWEQRGGRWALFADGQRRAGARGLSAGHPVPPGGILVLGQDQDSLGGGFSARDAFSGNLTDFHLWARALSPAQLHRARACAPPPGGLLFRWDPSALDITPSLLPPVRVRLRCPVPSEECPTWDPGPRTEGSLLCLQPRPFLCCYRTETYRGLQDTRSWPGQDVIGRVNALAKAIVLLADPLSEAHGELSPAEASSFLGIVERVLVEEAAPPGPAALLAVVHFLKRVTALGAGEPEPLTGPWEQLGRGVMSVASLVLEEQLARAWLAVSEVVGGPMALVVSVQRLAPLLSAMLTSERPQMHIQHRHAGLEVRSLRLRGASSEGFVFTMPGGRPDGPGHIHIPAGEPGLSGVTVIHSWFSSSVFQHTLGGPGLEPQPHDGSEEASRMQRFLSTQVGSAIISSEVWDETGEVNTAVTFHLQHQAQAFRQKLVEPVCAFWNFSISPDSGGSWATAGCSVAALYQDSTACSCNHSTNFAVLLQVYDVQRGPEEESLLRTLSFVGCGVSFCALATTFLLFLAARVPKSERATVHKNLTFSLASAEGFLMASEWAKDNKVGGQRVACVAVTAAMHLLFLVAFSWMLVEGLLLWSKVVAVSTRPGPRMTLYYAAGWGMPVAIVAVTLAMSPHDYVAPGHCWLNVHTDTIWAFVGPVLFVLTANTCILVRVVMVTVSSARRRARMLSPQPCLQQQIRIQIWATVKPVLVLLPVLGLTWLVGVLVHLSPAWAYAAVGLNSFQGPYIFLVYAAYNGEVRNALQRMTEKKAAEAFTVQAGPWEVAQDHPIALAPPRKHLALRGTRGPRIPTTFSSIADPERSAPRSSVTGLKGAGSSWELRTACWQNLDAKATGGERVITKAVELTAFKASAPLNQNGGHLRAATPALLQVKGPVHRSAPYWCLQVLR
ncbi:PREDICTED: adhesion G-protein coupled receptor D2 [Ceratotherium simum simum]|uniref:Adhesion G-protein coupled receptor D2 n=1 Tax=Ceratotherium simum simum TaxID=73337 RepID=A0ABM1CD09_CERSS|nr:PREDICTED: adhesion G-protein coupled receptor D2 [Ceratotherium simum simum]